MTSVNIPEPEELGPFLSHSGFTDPVKLEPLRQEASSRMYFRILFTGPESPSPVILVVDTPFPGPENHDFLQIRSWWERESISVPVFYGANPRKGWILLSDGGDLDLNSRNEALLSSSRSEQARFLTFRAIEELAHLHTLAPEKPVLHRSFDFAKLHWEMDFLLARLKYFLGEEQYSRLVPASLPSVLADLCRELDLPENFVVTHRDFHGRNILAPDSKNVVFIDFQDARMGLPEYDLASFLFDPYTDLYVTSEIREELLLHYESLTKIRIDRERFRRQSLQRLLKALGSYYFLSHEKGMEAYAFFIPKTIHRLQSLLNASDSVLKAFLSGLVAYHEGLDQN